MKRSVLLGVVACVGVWGAFAESGFRLAGVPVVCEDALVDTAKKGRGLEAARDLTNALFRVTGVPSALWRESDAPADLKRAIYLGETKAARAAGLNAASLRRGAFRLKVEADRAFVLANTGMATSYGVIEFLQRYADYWFVTLDGDDPAVVRPDVCAPVSDVTLEHAIYARHASYACSRYAATSENILTESYARRTRLTKGAKVTPKEGNTPAAHDAYRKACRDVMPELERAEIPSCRAGRTCHTFFLYCSPEKHFKDHPEYFSMMPDGRRQARPVGQICFSSKGALDVVTAQLLENIAADRRDFSDDYPLIYDFSQEDNLGFLCNCPDCKKTIAKYNRIKGGNQEGGDTGLMLEFSNELARRVAKFYPDVKIRVFAYSSTEELPPGIVPEPNLMVWFCDLYTKSCHMLPLTHPFNAYWLDQLKRWTAASKNFEIWDYYLYGGPWEGNFPEVQVDAIRADVRLFRDLGIDRIYTEVHYEKQPFFELNTFVLTQLYFNPDADVELLVDRYCRVYGKGAAKMREAIGFLRGLIAANPPKDADAWHCRILPWRTAENWTRFVALVKAAYDADPTPRARARTASALASTAWELARIYRAKPGASALYATAKRDYTRYSAEELDLFPLDPTDVEKTRTKVRNDLGLLDLEFKDLPPGVDRKAEMTPVDWRTSYAHPAFARAVADPDSECEKSTRWTPSVDRQAPYAATLIDDDLRTRVSFSFTPLTDGKYHWIKLGRGRVGRNGHLKVFDFDYLLKNFYIECDGLATDPNVYDFWLSVKQDGPAKTDDLRRGLFCDRLLLVRVKESR